MYLLNITCPDNHPKLKQPRREEQIGGMFNLVCFVILLHELVLGLLLFGKWVLPLGDAANVS